MLSNTLKGVFALAVALASRAASAASFQWPHSSLGGFEVMVAAAGSTTQPQEVPLKRTKPLTLPAAPAAPPAAQPAMLASAQEAPTSPALLPVAGEGAAAAAVARKVPGFLLPDRTLDLPGAKHSSGSAASQALAHPANPPVLPLAGAPDSPSEFARLPPSGVPASSARRDHRSFGFRWPGWAAVYAARKAGPHHRQTQVAPATDSPAPGPAANESPATEELRVLFESATCSDWYFLAMTIVVLVIIDVGILQQLPETARTHLVLLGFWLLVAGVYCFEIWLRWGLPAVSSWTAGYVLEVVFSVDKIFALLLVFSALETPQRLISKSLFVGLIASIGLRLAFAAGLAAWLENLRVLPYAVGVVLLYCGTRQLTTSEEDDVDVTQTGVVRAAKFILGDRLCEFYDEEGEAVFMVSRGKLCVTLLGVALGCIFLTDLVLSPDVVLTKAEQLSNPFLNFSSSALALFGIRALFLLVRDAFLRVRLARLGVGAVLLVAGVELLLARAAYVNALLAATLAVGLAAGSVGLSVLRTPPPKV